MSSLHVSNKFVKLNLKYYLELHCFLFVLMKKECHHVKQAKSYQLKLILVGTWIKTCNGGFEQVLVKFGWVLGLFLWSSIPEKILVSVPERRTNFFARLELPYLWDPRCVVVFLDFADQRLVFGLWFVIRGPLTARLVQFFHGFLESF